MLFFAIWLGIVVRLYLCGCVARVIGAKGQAGAEEVGEAGRVEAEQRKTTSGEALVVGSG